MKKINNNLTSFESHIEEQYGERGTKMREEYEEGFEAFKLGAMIQELRKEQGLTQEQLAQKCGTTKTYISRIENSASDIRLSTLMRIINEGLGGQLKLSVDLFNDVKSSSGVINLPENFDHKKEYQKHIVSKYSN